MNKIYMDNAATTPVRMEVLNEMIPYFNEYYGNPSSIYQSASISKKAIEKARKNIAKAIGASAEEIYFTSCGTESNNWALTKTAENMKQKEGHIITSKVEHPSIIHMCKHLESKGFDVTYLPVDEYGCISIEDLKNAIKSNTFLISIMTANNEIGSIQPIKEIGLIAKEKKILFHTDAVQAFGHIPIDVNEMNISLLSLSAHKINGPKGVGALYIRNNTILKSLLLGGGQERNRRAGTENVPGIIGFGKAAELSLADIDKEPQRLIELREKLINGILSKVPYTKVNGHRDKRLPGNVNISFDFVEGETVLILLDSKGIAASSGSACTSGSPDPSHVLLAIGLSHEKARGSIRFTLGMYNTEEEIDEIIKELPPIIEKLRSISPLYESYIKKIQNI